MSVGVADEAEHTSVDADAGIDDAKHVQWWRRGRRPSLDRKTGFALATALVVATLPFFDVLAGRRTAMFGDVNDLFIPAYVAVWRQIMAGHLPWWTPDVFAGHSMLGAGQYAVFYPLNVLFGLFSPVTAYRWWLMLHIWLATASAFTWSLRRFGSRAGAIVSGVAYVCSGFAVLHLVHPPFVIGVAWLPVLFIGVDMVRERWTTARAALVVVAVAMIGFAGQPQILWIATIAVLVYTFSLWYLSDESHMVPLRAVTAIGLGLGVAALQLLPTWRFSHNSVRPKLAMRAAFEANMLPRNLFTFVFPWIYGGSRDGTTFTEPWHGGFTQHEVANFAGATIVVIAVLAFFWLRRETVVKALALVVAVSLLISLGGATPFGHLVYKFVPGAKSFRVWARTSLTANLAFAMLAGAGVREVLKRPRRALPPLIGATVALTVVAVALPHVARFRRYMATGSYELVARGFPVLCLIALLASVAVMVSYPRFGAFVLVGVCLFEVLAFARVAEWREASGDAKSLHEFYDQSQPPSFGPAYDAPGGIDRWVSDSYGFRSVSLVKDMHGVNGYDALMQKDWAQTAGGFAYDGYPTRPDFWSGTWLPDVLRVTTMVLNNKITPTDPSWKAGGGVPGLDYERWIRTPRLAEAYLVGDAHVTNLAGARTALLDPRTPLLTSAFVERGDARVGGLHDSRPPGTVVSADVLGRGSIDVDAQRPALLVLSHDWEPGWHATVDGHSTAVLRTNGLVLGVYVPAGRHTVRVHFTPPGLHTAAWLAFVALLLLPAIGPLSRRMRFVSLRRKTATPPSGARERDHGPIEV